MSLSKLPFRLKPTVFPTDFVLLVDTREQNHLFQRLPRGLLLQSATLSCGDYSIRGYEDLFMIERKGVRDLYPYCSTERDKTLTKLNMLCNMQFAGLVIEAMESDVMKPQFFTGVSPETVRQSIISFQVKWGVHVYYGSREQCARWVLDTAVRFYHLKREA